MFMILIIFYDLIQYLIFISFHELQYDVISFIKLRIFVKI